jgi:hypothetical protein
MRRRITASWSGDGKPHPMWERRLAMTDPGGAHCWEPCPRKGSLSTVPKTGAEGFGSSHASGYLVLSGQLHGFKGRLWLTLFLIEVQGHRDLMEFTLPSLPGSPKTSAWEPWTGERSPCLAPRGFLGVFPTPCFARCGLFYQSGSSVERTGA